MRIELYVSPSWRLQSQGQMAASVQELLPPAAGDEPWVGQKASLGPSQALHVEGC